MNFLQRFSRASKRSMQDIIEELILFIGLVLVVTSILFPIILAAKTYSRKNPVENPTTTSGIILVMSDIQNESFKTAEADVESVEHYVQAVTAANEREAKIKEEKRKAEEEERKAEEKQKTKEEAIPSWNGEVLNKTNGVVYGPSGKETYYNLDMSGVIRIMRSLGYDYDYWVRDDGVKCFGEYIMLATNTNVYPKGTIVETTRGTGMVCDHCERAEYDPVFDLAVSW